MEGASPAPRSNSWRRSRISSRSFAAYSKRSSSAAASISSSSSTISFSSSSGRADLLVARARGAGSSAAPATPARGSRDMSEMPFFTVSAVMPCSRVVGDLDLAAAVGLADRGPHRGRLPVRVHQDPALHVPRRPPDRLDQARLPAQEALLVGVEDRDQRHLRQVEALAQQVHAHQHVVLAEPQVADDLDPLDRVDLRVQVAHPDAVLEQVARSGPRPSSSSAS